MKESTSPFQLVLGGSAGFAVRWTRPETQRGRVVAGVAAVLPLAFAGWLGGWKAFLLTLIASIVGAAAFLAPGLAIAITTLLLPATERFEVLGASVAPFEAGVGGAALGFLALLLVRGEKVELRAVHWVWGGFLLAVAVSTLGPVDNSDRIRQLAFWCALGVFFYAVSSLTSGRDRRMILFALCAAGAFEASLALFEYFSRLSDRFVRLEGAIVYPLPEGTLLHANALGAFLVVAALSILALGLGERGFVRRLAVASALLCVAGTAVTFSRGAWITLALASVVFVADRSTRRVALLAATCVVGLGFALLLAGGSELAARATSLFSAVSSSEFDELYGFRLDLAGRGVEVAASHPLTGLGDFEESGLYAGRTVGVSHPHNLFVGLAVFYGIPAALAFAGVIALVARSLVGKLRASGKAHARAPLIGSLAVIAAILVNGLFEYPFWNVSLTGLIVLALALASADRRAGSATPGVGT